MNTMEKYYRVCVTINLDAIYNEVHKAPVNAYY